MVLFCSAPTMGCLAVLIPEPLWVRRMVTSLCALLHCLLFVIGYIQSFAEMKMPSEITQKFITGPNGQKFTESTERDEEQGEGAQEMSEHMQFDMSTTTPQEEAQATAVRDSVRKSVRASLLLASFMWFFVVLSTFSVFFDQDQESVAEDLETVSLQWSSRSVWPHAIAVAGDKAFIADKYRVFRVPITGGAPQEVLCQFTGTIADVAATCDDGAQNCHPLVLLEGESGRVVDCVTGEDSVMMQQSSDDHLKSFALHAGSMMAILGNSVVEYRQQTELHGWRPLWEKTQVDGIGARSLDYDAQRLYIFEHLM